MKNSKHIYSNIYIYILFFTMIAIRKLIIFIGKYYYDISEHRLRLLNTNITKMLVYMKNKN